ncbi:hypothetical protein VNO77_05003 [Canavalia gladiata]|uniref:NPH3 domain-containing protein n=1 Tax=Canavalia gladiata TaxID=3824 RepID=A0AAN9N2M1_CANGL
MRLQSLCYTINKNAFMSVADSIGSQRPIHRIIINFLQSEMGNHIAYNADDDEYFSPSQRDIYRLGKLMEIISLAELIPEQSRPTEDGMYRAIDIYLKLRF